MQNLPPLVVVVPAAGIGKRMKSSCPKQYLEINHQTILEHTIARLAAHPLVFKIIIALGHHDEYFPTTGLFDNEKVSVVIGGKERVDSVLAGLQIIDPTVNPWVLVHDAARPCLTLSDLDKLINACLQKNLGGILATPVKDTMKRAKHNLIDKTVEREYLWHALTPQMFPTKQLKEAIELALHAQAHITDEASAIEFINEQCQIVEGSSENIKITHPDDLAYAEFIITKQNNQQLQSLAQE